MNRHNSSPLDMGCAPFPGLHFSLQPVRTLDLWQ
jgi:hypothetical protein